MDLFSINKETYEMKEAIIGVDSVSWVERFNSCGEFTIICDPTSYFRDAFALGTFISHSNTTEVMEVETHFIDETKEGPPKLEVTGRSISGIIMENRVVSLSDIPLSSSTPTWPWEVGIGESCTSPMEFYLSASYSWEHVRALLERYLVNPDPWLHPGDSPDLFECEPLPNFEVVLDISALELTSYARVIEYGAYLSDAVYGILQTEDIGLRVIRPLNTGDPMRFSIRLGNDVSNAIHYISDLDELVKGRYLWSKKTLKTGGYAFSDPVTIRSLDNGSYGDSTNWGTKNVSVNVRDWHNADSIDPIPVLNGRLADEVHRSNETEYIEADVSSSKYKCGQDYELGDIVWVASGYEEGKKMRVVEYACNADANGENFVATFAVPNPWCQNISYSIG